MKKNIIMISIIVVCITSLLLVIYNVNKNTYYISDVTEIKDENLDISMSQIVGNEETVITETPTSGLWRIETEGEGCTSEKVTISWNSNAHKLKVRVKQSPIKCKITFVEVKADIQLISMYVNGKGLTNGSTLPEGNYKLYDYACTDINGTSLPNTTVEWNNNSITITPLTKQTICQLYFGEIKNYSYTGSAQTFTAPEDGWYRVELWGAQSKRDIAGAKGGYTSGIIELLDGETLQVYVGEGLKVKADGISFNGGTGDAGGSAGGGATDIRLVGGDWDNALSLNSRIMVAGGGGNGRPINNQGSGGNLIGMSGGSNTTYPTVATGGTQTSGGTKNYTPSTAVSGFGVGNVGCAGGGGYYGGGGAICAASAGGGSSYISGYAGSNSIVEGNTTTPNRQHTNQTKHYSGKYFIAGEMQQGINAGNGTARITYEGASKPTRINTALNGVRYIKDCATGNGKNNYVFWDEIQAIKDGVNLAQSVGSIDTTGELHATESATAPYSRTINGIVGNYGATSNNPTTPTKRCLTIDLGQEYDLDEVMVLHLASEIYPQFQPYYNNVTSVAGTNKTYREVIKTQEVETSSGKRVNAYEDIPTGYIQDGLQVWYDGMANNPSSSGLYNSGSSLWVNLINNLQCNGQLQGNAVFSQNENALLLNGTDAWVSIAQLNYANPTIEVVFESEVIYTSLAASIVANEQQGGHANHLHNGKLCTEFYINGAYHTLYSKTYITSKKATLTGSYNSSAIKLHINGTLENTMSISGAIGNPALNTIMAIGTNPAGSVADGNFFKGKVYSVRIYNRALTDEEVKWNYEVDKKRFGLE